MKKSPQKQILDSKRLQRRENLMTAAWLAALVLFWELAPRVGLANAYLLPPFSSVVEEMVNQLFTGTLGRQTLSSLLLVLFGCVLSVVISIAATFLCIYSKAFETLFRALCTVFNPLPGLAVIPLIMMWFGIGTGAMVVLIVHGVIWPLVTELLAGFRSVPPIYRDFSRNIGLSPFKETFFVLFFAVMPSFLAGLRIGWGRAWRALIGAEMVFGTVGEYGGIGYYIYVQRSFANIPRMLAGVLVIVIMGIVIEQFGFRLIEKATIEKWGMSNAK